MALLDPALREACRSLGVLESYFESVLKKTPPAATMASRMRAVHVIPSQEAAAIQSPAKRAAAADAIK